MDSHYAHVSESSRMRALFENFRLAEVAVPQDGNCQFSSVAHQLFGQNALGPWGSVRSKRILHELRAMVADWLRVNRKTRVGDAALEEFVEPIHDSWEAYCDYIEGDTNWGDHLSLVAIANLFRVKIIVVGSGAVPVTVVDPIRGGGGASSTGRDVVIVSHWHERHYNSLVAQRRSL